ncbi:sialic acid-binding Ig-like lectin 13 [Nothobranchius furzeri]|uniref:sialic acid-binding Ig-like lectin 13 n=1 Tax=Nothobranchius furzeri TaxID=105023 RepID=UPI0039046D00
MKEDHQSLMSATMVMVHMLLSVFFLPDVWAAADYCGGLIPAFKITTPNMMEALNGSCLLIPCSITPTTFVISKQSSGFWIKGDSYIYYSGNSVKSFPVTITGNLTQRDCTTVFSDLNTSHSGAYFFRIDSSSSKGTACADPLQITVKDSPWRPRINISGGLEDLKEKESVSITCSAPTPCPLSPPELTWNLQPDSYRQTQKNPDGTSLTKIQENMTLSDTHDGYNITCSVSYPVDGGKRLNTTETVTLHVSYAPKDTSASISPSGLVSAGSWVKLSCSSRAKPPVSSFSWFRNSSKGPVQVSEEQLYSFNVSEGGEFYCVAANNLGNQTSSWIKLRLTQTGDLNKSWEATLGGVLGVVLICLTVAVCCFKCKHQTQQQSQNPSAEKASAETPSKEAQLHYGDVNIFKVKASSEPKQGTGQQEQKETVYTEVKASKETGDSPEDLYSKVK